MRELLRRLAIRHDTPEVVREIDALSDDASLSIGFVGAYNAGKTTLVNALLGEKLLPAGQRPTTGAATEIVVDAAVEAPRRTRVLENGAVELLDADAFAEVALGRLPGVPCLAVPPRPGLPVGYTLVDTPGLQSVHEIHTDITFGTLPRLDGFVLCVHAASGAPTATDLSLLTRPDVAPYADRCVLALLQADTLPGLDAVEKVRRKSVRAFGGVLGLPEEEVERRVVTVRAADALGGDPTGLDGLLAAFLHVFVAPAAQMRERRIRRALARLGRSLQAALQERLDSLALDDEGFARRVVDARASLDALEVTRREQLAQLDAFRRTLRSDLEPVGRRFVSRIASVQEVEQLDAVCTALADDAQRVVNATLAGFAAGLEAPDARGLDGDVVASIRNVLHGRDLATALVTAALLAMVTGGSSVAANTAETAAGAVAKEAARQASNRLGDAVATGAKVVAGGAEAAAAASKGAATWARVLRIAGGAISSVVEKANPVNYLGRMIADVVKRTEAERGVQQILDQIAAESAAALRRHLETEVLAPMRLAREERLRQLHHAESDRRLAEDALQAQRGSLRRDLAEIEDALTVAERP